MDNTIKVWRAREDLTQAELAEDVGVTRQTINALERGRYDPSLELAFRIAHRFDCDVEDVFEWEPDDDPAAGGESSGANGSQ